MVQAKLRSNVVALSVLQISNYLIPLITLPYLTRILGASEFGKVALVQATASYLVLLTDFGFSWSATRKIAACRDDPGQVSAIFSATWFAQWVLALMSGLVLVAIVAMVPSASEEHNLYLSGYLLVLGNVLLPMWLLQGLERIGAAALIQVSARVVAVPAIFLFVTTVNDAALALAITGMSSIIAGFASLLWMKYSRIVSWTYPSITDLKTAFVEGCGLFLSRLAVSLYTLMVPLVLAAIAGTTAVAYFNIADKARNAGQSMLSPVSQALFPRMSHLYNRDPGSARQLLKRSVVLIFILSAMVSIGLWSMADLIILLLGGRNYEPAVDVLRWFAVVPFFVAMSNVFGVQIMLPNTLNKAFNIILASAALVATIVIWPLVAYGGAIGAAQAILIAELWVMSGMGLYLWRKGYLFKVREIEK